MRGLSSFGVVLLALNETMLGMWLSAYQSFQEAEMHAQLEGLRQIQLEFLRMAIAVIESEDPFAEATRRGRIEAFGKLVEPRKH